MVTEHKENSLRGHKLLTKGIEKKLEKYPIYSQDGLKVSEKKVILKFFSPYNNWTWFVTEYDKETKEFFGIVVGHETEMGYFSYMELETANKNGLPLVERDCYFTPCQVKDIPALKKYH